MIDLKKKYGMDAVNHKTVWTGVMGKNIFSDLKTQCNAEHNLVQHYWLDYIGK